MTSHPFLGLNMLGAASPQLKRFGCYIHSALLLVVACAIVIAQFEHDKSNSTPQPIGLISFYKMQDVSLSDLKWLRSDPMCDYSFR